jgi:hypothetical protein
MEIIHTVSSVGYIKKKLSKICVRLWDCQMSGEKGLASDSRSGLGWSVQHQSHHPTSAPSLLPSTFTLPYLRDISAPSFFLVKLRPVTPK